MCTVLFRHDPRALHPNKRTLLVPAVLATLPGGNVYDTVAIVGTSEVDEGVVVDGSTEECLTRVARQTSKVHALGFVPADSACFGVLAA